MVKKTIEKTYKRLFGSEVKNVDLKEHFLTNGKIPWSKGYNKYKWELINSSIIDTDVLDGISQMKLPISFGHRVDERVIEYPWIFSNLTDNPEKLLDAGSTLNFKSIIEHPKVESKDVTIFTFSPEKNCFNKKGISYVYGDLRALPFKDNWFDTIVSQSTIEHIDMDNSIYGYDITHNEDETKKSYDYLEAVKEMLRVLDSNGNLLITFPYGKFENHGFFQQFDEEMLNRLLELFNNLGDFDCTFFKYSNEGWLFSEKDELVNVVSYNPHTGKGKLNDNAAHCRSVVCINFTKF
jgi:ubiquinone/menaquinone biosynthesis C-methylase UbiE